jgi:hypothetical protein
MKPAEACKIMRTVDEFKNGKYGQEDKKQQNNFSSRLSALRRDQLECKDTRANSDADALAHDRALFPAPATDTLGVPGWEGSESQRSLLKADIEAGVHLTFQTLKALYGAPVNGTSKSTQIRLGLSSGFTKKSRLASSAGLSIPGYRGQILANPEMMEKQQASKSSNSF